MFKVTDKKFSYKNDLRIKTHELWDYQLTKTLRKLRSFSKLIDNPDNNNITTL